MSFLPASRTKRNLFKIASLGLAGLLAGLLSGCNDSPDTSVSAPYTHVASDSYNPNASAEAQPSPLPKSIEATQVPRPPASALDPQPPVRVGAHHIPGHGSERSQSFLATAPSTPGNTTNHQLNNSTTRRPAKSGRRFSSCGRILGEKASLTSFFAST